MKEALTTGVTELDGSYIAEFLLEIKVLSKIEIKGVEINRSITQIIHQIAVAAKVMFGLRAHRIQWHPATSPAPQA